MPKAMIFWVLILFWLIGGIGYPMFATTPNQRVVYGSNILLLVLIVLIGLQVFGSAVK